MDKASPNQLVELTSRKSESAKRPKKKDDSTVGSLALLAASNTQSEMERSDNHFLLIQKMKVATKKAGNKWNRLMNLYTKYGDALYELKKKKKEETGTAEIEEIDEELRFLKGKLTKVKKDMEED